MRHMAHYSRSETEILGQGRPTRADTRPTSQILTVMIAVASAAFEGEIGATAMVNPDAPVIRTPAVAFAAGGLASLLNQLDSAWSRGTIVPSTIVRGARNCDAAPTSPADWSPVLVCTDCKVSPAATVNPDASTVKTPAVALLAG